MNQYTAIGAQTTGGTNCAGHAQGLSYDCNGNLTYDGNLTFGYDAENRLLTASKTGLAATYQYDPLGRRTRKSGTGVTDTFYLSDGSDEIAEYDGTSGALTERYIPGPAIDEPVAMVDGTTGAKEYFHANHQGSAVTTTDDTSTGWNGCEGRCLSKCLRARTMVVGGLSREFDHEICRLRSCGIVRSPSLLRRIG